MRIGEKKILQTIIENGKPMKISAIMEILDCPYQSVYYHLVKKGRGKESLLESGYVSAVDGKSAYRGRHTFLYKVTKKGRKYSQEMPDGDRLVLQVMIESGDPMTIPDIARALNKNPTTIRYHLVDGKKSPNKKSLLDRGLVRVRGELKCARITFRTYVVTKNGRDYYKESVG